MTRRVRRTLRHWRRRMEPQVAVLMYHRVADVPCDPWDQCVTPQHFDEHLSILKRHVDVIPLADVPRVLDGGSDATRAIAITFDDGYADNLYAATPILMSHELPATFFLTTGALGQEREFWWDELERLFLSPSPLPARLELTISGHRRVWSLSGDNSGGDEEWNRHRMWRAWNPPETARQRVYLDVWNLLRSLPANIQEAHLDEIATWAGASTQARPLHRILTPAEVRRLAAEGRFEIGAHSVSHSALSEHPLAAQEEEIRESKASIESLVSRPARHFAYPYGDFSAETVMAVREAGFSGACTTREGMVDRRGSRWTWPRCKVYDWSGEEFSHRLKAMLQHA